MNSNTQAQKGFKTFILTLAISLAVFSAIYYVINSETDTTRQVPLAQEILSSPEAKTTNTGSETLGETSERPEEPEVSVFGDLANRRIGGPQPGEGAVLAGAETGEAVTTTTPDLAPETTESTVPDTGVSGPTIGIFLTLIILSLVIYIYFVGPRKIALSSFEKDVLDEFD